MTGLASVNRRLDELMRSIESNSAAAQEHRSRAGLASTGALLALLLTSGSRSETTRTVGNLAAAGGFLYGAHQGNRAATLDAQSMGLVDSALGLVEAEGLRSVRVDPLHEARRRFVELVMRLSGHVDAALERYGPGLARLNMLRSKNRDLMLHATHVDIVRSKLRMNRALTGIDGSVAFPDHEGTFQRSVAGLDAAQLSREAHTCLAIIVGSLLLGVAFAEVKPIGSLFLLVGLCFWALNHWFPVFPQMRRLKASVAALVDGLSQQPAGHALRLRVPA